MLHDYLESGYSFYLTHDAAGGFVSSKLVECCLAVDGSIHRGYLDFND